ncbi:sulfatase family protein [Marasmitruncus massiliensis]|uniref:sulfatase family protein n=1 Tax=Marasmitruncus massiliensis TaxID=1944642 RepID=UPI000C7D1F18|nr:sulfatase-like hydrolase/transferase [Marasmitruncus massiliensis]
MDKKPLNVVWFCTDQQRWDTIHCMGNPYIHTPHIDKFASEGVAFSRAYTQSPVCTPSRSCFLTGRYPRATRDTYNGSEVYSKDEVLVTKMLADQGYTCGLTGKLHLTGACGRMEARTDDGYSYMQWSHHPHDDWPKGINCYQNWLEEKGLKWEDIYGGRYTSLAKFPPEQNPNFTGKDVGVPAKYHQTTWCVEKAIEFIETCKDTSKPWLVSINPFDPHPPLDPPQEYKDRLKVEDMPLPLWEDGELWNKTPIQQKDYYIGGQNGSTESITKKSEYDKKEYIRDYYAQIELIDDQFGRLMEYLDRTDQRENTLVIFMSDHGDMCGDHGVYWKGVYFYEGLVHVPLIMSLPGIIQQNVVSEALIELVDIAPTILELLGKEVPQYMQGKSFAKLLKGKAPLHKHKESVYSEYYWCVKNVDREYGTMYFDGRYKIVNYHYRPYGELYDLQEDPHEFHNLWSEPHYAELKAELMKKNFDDAIMKNMDYILEYKYEF